MKRGAEPIGHAIGYCPAPQQQDAILLDLATRMPAEDRRRPSGLDGVSFEPRPGWLRRPRVIEGVSMDVWVAP